jgi:hypothetical protein
VSVRPIVWGQRRLDLGFDQTDFLVDACKRRDVVVDLLDTRCQLVSVDLDPADVLTECSGLHDQDPSDPLADRQEIVAVRTDDQVDVMLELPGDPPVIPAFLGHREAEVREQDHEPQSMPASKSRNGAVKPKIPTPPSSTDGTGPVIGEKFASSCGWGETRACCSRIPGP